MIKKISMKSSTFGDIKIDDFAPINLFIGENATGKTTMLKILYALTWCVKYNSDLDTIGSVNYTIRPILKELSIDDKILDSTVVLTDVESNNFIQYNFMDGFDDIIGTNDKTAKYYYTPIFIPAKEVLSIMSSISYTRNQGISDFDASYGDIVEMVRVLRHPFEEDGLNIFRENKNYGMYNGKVEAIRDDNGNLLKIEYSENNKVYDIKNVAEGIKRMGVFSILAQSGFLTKKTVLFIDEPENSIHPHALRELMRFLYDISKEGVQIFIASHNSFVLNQLSNIAEKEKYKINVFAFLKDKGNIKIERPVDLSKEFPSNKISDEAIAMYEERD